MSKIELWIAAFLTIAILGCCFVEFVKTIFHRTPEENSHPAGTPVPHGISRKTIILPLLYLMLWPISLHADRPRFHAEAKAIVSWEQDNPVTFSGFVTWSSGRAVAVWDGYDILPVRFPEDWPPEGPDVYRGYEFKDCTGDWDGHQICIDKFTIEGGVPPIAPPDLPEELPVVTTPWRQSDYLHAPLIKLKATRDQLKPPRMCRIVGKLTARFTNGIPLLNDGTYTCPVYGVKDTPIGAICHLQGWFYEGAFFVTKVKAIEAPLPPYVLFEVSKQ